MLVNQLWKVNIIYKEGTYESFHLQKRYENELEVEFYFKFIFSEKEKMKALMLKMKLKVSRMLLKDGQNSYSNVLKSA